MGFNNSIGDFVLDENKDTAKYSDLRNWSCAAGYGVGSRSPLSPSFNFGLELARSSQVSICTEQFIYSSIMLSDEISVFHSVLVFLSLADIVTLFVNAVYRFVLPTCSCPKAGRISN